MVRGCRPVQYQGLLLCVNQQVRDGAKWGYKEAHDGQRLKGVEPFEATSYALQTFSQYTRGVSVHEKIS